MKSYMLEIAIRCIHDHEYVKIKQVVLLIRCVHYVIGRINVSLRTFTMLY